MTREQELRTEVERLQKLAHEQGQEIAITRERDERLESHKRAQAEDIMTLGQEIGRLRRLLIDAPVLIIDERNARLLGEQEALVYMQALRAWHPKVQAALGLDEKGATLTSAIGGGAT